MLILGGTATETFPQSGFGAELFDPSANGGLGAFTLMGGMASSRRSAITTILPSGKVLIVGGEAASCGAAANAELFDPAANGGAGSFTSSARPSAPNGLFAALLCNGKVLIVRSDTAAELFDPAGGGGSGAFMPTGTLLAGRSGSVMSRLPNGQVLFSGGFYFDTAEVYVP